MISSAPSPNLELRHGFSGKWKRAVDGYDGVPGWGAELLKKYSRRGRRVVVEEEGKGEEVAALSASPEQPRKACAECKTSKTPMWRSGPHGPKSLCNACGIRVKKRESKKMKGEKKGISSSSSSNKWLSQEEMRNSKRETQERRMLFLMTKRQRQREEELRRKASTAMMKPKEGRGKRKVIVGGGGGGNERREAEQAAHLLLSLSSAVFVRS